jgi:hypothetical protein
MPDQRLVFQVVFQVDHPSKPAGGLFSVMVPDQILMRPCQHLDRFASAESPGDPASVVPIGARQIGKEFGVGRKPHQPVGAGSSFKGRPTLQRPMTLTDRRLRNSVPRTSTDEWTLAVNTHWRVPSVADDRVQLRAGWQLAARRSPTSAWNSTR